MNRDDERVIEGMKRQAELRESLLADASRLGWKSGFGTEGAMDLLGINQPLTGFLTKATLAESGGVVAVSDWGMPLLEAEVAVRIDRELGPGVTPEQATSAIGAVAAAIELVDLGSIESVEEILAGNIFHRKVLLGEFIELADSSLDEVRIAVDVNGAESGPSDPRDVIGEIGRVVADLADQAELADETFQPGDVVITGAAVPPAPVKPGERYEVKLTAGSSVAVEIG
jgi:2-keto-4-pentenoate hydratase